jgi:hypothetical protein
VLDTLSAMEVLVLIVVLGGFVLAVVLQVAHFASRDARRERRSVPASRRMAQRRQFRGFEGDLLAQRDPSWPRRDPDAT